MWALTNVFSFSFTFRSILCSKLKGAAPWSNASTSSLCRIVPLNLSSSLSKSRSYLLSQKFEIYCNLDIVVRRFSSYFLRPEYSGSKFMLSVFWQSSWRPFVQKVLCVYRKYLSYLSLWLFCELKWVLLKIWSSSLEELTPKPEFKVLLRYLKVLVRFRYRLWDFGLWKVLLKPTLFDVISIQPDSCLLRSWDNPRWDVASTFHNF